MIKSSPNRQHPAVYLSIITQFYPPDYAATGQLIEELSQELIKRLKDWGFQVQIFTGQPGYAFRQPSAPASEVADGLKVKRSRTSRFWPNRIRGRAINGILFSLRAGLRLLSPWHRTDLLLLTTEPPYLNLLGIFAKCVLGIPYICLIYDLYPDIAIALDVIPRRHWIARFWHQANCWVWNHAEAVIVLSSTMKDRIVAKCPEVEDKIRVIHSWSDPDQIKPIPKTKNWFAQQHGLDRQFTVLYSGNMGRCHDMQTIMRAAQLLRDDPVRFVFIGHGAKRNFCLEFAESQNLENCLFLPYQDRKVLPYSLTACDVSLISVYQGMEGLVAPSKLYSSLAAGKPIATICERHSYLRTILQEAQCGAAFDNGDCHGLATFIRFLAQDSRRVEELGLAGRRYLQRHFTPAKIAQDYSDVILSCVRATPDPRDIEWAFEPVPKPPSIVGSSVED